MGKIRTAVANACARLVIDYGPDPHNPAQQLGNDAVARLNVLQPFVGGGNSDPSNSWWGWTASPQEFKGIGSLNVVAGQDDIVRDGAFPQVSDAIVANSLGDPTRRAFLARLRRGGGL